MRIRPALAALSLLTVACGTSSPTTLTDTGPEPTYACTSDLVDVHEEIIALPTGPQDPDTALNGWLQRRDAPYRVADMLAINRDAGSATYQLLDDAGTITATIRVSYAGAAWAVTDYEFCAEDRAELGDDA